MELDKKEFTLKGKAIYKKIEPTLKDELLLLMLNQAIMFLVMTN